MENLTTPEMRDFDASCPAENWFLYWKTSSSLWETKLRDYQGVSPIIVPIFWALHSDYQDHYDFGHQKPETNLRRLSEIARSLGVKIVFAIPVSPAPFLTNGGVPSYLARQLSENQERLAVTVIDSVQMVNKVYSFYDPKVFQAYRKFVFQLGSYFSQAGISEAIYGLNCHRIEGGHIVSYFKDYSKSFQDGFARYIKQIKDSEPEKVQGLSHDEDSLVELKHEYSLLISSLYLDAAKETLAGNWRGELSTCLLGGSSVDLFRRSFDQWDHENDYFMPLMKSIVHGVYPSSILLDSKIKSKALGKALKDTVNQTFVRSLLDDDYYSDDSSLSYSPLVFFELNDWGEGHFSFENAMQESGLSHFFNSEYPWSYHISREYKQEFDDLENRKVFFFFGERLDQNGIKQILKLFMSGQRIFLDTHMMSDEVASKFRYFLVENEIKTEQVNYISPVMKASLGEGLVITYDRQKLAQTSLLKRKGFWQTMVSYLELKHMQVDQDSDVQFFWMKRAANSFELSYEEIRRVHVYNPTSYKKKMRFKSTAGFAFLRSVDEKFVEIKSTPIGIELLMMPGGSITIDFGCFEP